ncbi:sodium channel protein Nach-like [Epargyreus clarus]|uniref:sodium channel protein Nach-like n=1 Tax=Epargyreus clarus TaxID=520877 RepID=UPI003C2C0407
MNYLLMKLKNKIQFFGDMSGLHGVRYVFSTTHIALHKRIFWFLVLASCSVSAFVLLHSALRMYVAGAVAYSVETNYLHWNTPFPAVTVCELSDTGQARAYVSANKLPAAMTNFYKDIAFWNILYCKTCINCKMNHTCAEDFQKAVNKIRLKCSDLLTDCWWGGKHFSCCDRFRPIETEYGTCFSFNSVLYRNSSIFNVNRKVGLPNLEFTATELIGIRIHSPNDRVSVALENILGRFGTVPLVTDFEIILRAEQTVNDLSVQNIPQDIRDCLFRYERPRVLVWPFQEYTYSACILNCKAVAQNTFCNCTHHFLSKIVGIPACDVKGLACLNSNREKLITFKCVCPMSCEDIQYKMAHVFYYRHSGKVPAELQARGSRGLVRLAALPPLRVRRLAIRDVLGLVVDVGGVGGVFFGASLLSLIELIYLLCIRQAR